MKKIIAAAILGFVWLFLVWLAFSFALWDLNAGNWDAHNRYACAFLGFFPPMFIIPQIWSHEA